MPRRHRALCVRLGGNSCNRCEANQVCRDSECGLFTNGDYDASFPDGPGGHFNPDAGTFHPSDSGTRDAGSLRGDAGMGMVSFANDVAPIFNSHCGGCHTWDSPVTLSAAVRN